LLWLPDIHKYVSGFYQYFVLDIVEDTDVMNNPTDVALKSAGQVLAGKAN